MGKVKPTCRNETGKKREMVIIINNKMLRNPGLIQCHFITRPVIEEPELGERVHLFRKHICRSFSSGKICVARIKPIEIEGDDLADCEPLGFALSMKFRARYCCNIASCSDWNLGFYGSAWISPGRQRQDQFLRHVVYNSAIGLTTLCEL
jgi:hypothetical protein